MKPLTLSLLVLGGALAGPVPARAQGVPETPAALVAVSIQIDGRPVSLFPAPDGSGRYYLEARAGSRYAVALANRTGERVGVVLTVDGLNAISGERDNGRGRMYVLDPWQSTSVQGWRSSLQEVRQFTFVDERRSYATRSGQGQREDGLDRGRGVPRAPRVRPGAALAVLRAAATLPGRRAGESRTRAGSRGGREAPSAQDSAEASSRPESDAAARSYPGHRLGRAHARSRGARELRPRGRAARAHHAALRVPPGARRPRRAAPADAPARPPLAARRRPSPASRRHPAGRRGRRGPRRFYLTGTAARPPSR